MRPTIAAAGSAITVGTSRSVGANLSGADLRGADLRGANLSGTILRHADLTDALLDPGVAIADPPADPPLDPGA